MDIKATLKEAWNEPGTKATLLFGLMACLALIMAFTYKEAAVEHCQYICDLQCATLTYADGYTCQCSSVTAGNSFNTKPANRTLIGGQLLCATRYPTPSAPPANNATFNLTK